MRTRSMLAMRSSLAKRVMLSLAAVMAVGLVGLPASPAAAADDPPSTEGEYDVYDFVIETRDLSGNLLYTESVEGALPPEVANPEQAGGLTPCWRSVDDGTFAATGATMMAAPPPGDDIVCADGSIAYRSSVKSASGCRTLYAGINRYSATGSRLYRFVQEKYSCWSGGRITYQTYTAYLAYTDGDRYLRGVERWEYPFSFGGQGDGGHRSFTKGTVEACLWIGCYGVAYPEADIYVYGDGTYYWKAYTG